MKIAINVMGILTICALIAPVAFGRERHYRERNLIHDRNNYRDRYRDNYRHNDRNRHRDHNWRNRGNFFVTCAPEVRAGNLAATSRLLSETTRLEEFRDASKLRQELKRIEKLSSNRKIKAYFEMAGVDDNDSSSVFEFINTQEIDSKVLDSLSENLELSREQSEILASRLQKSLLGGLTR